MKSCIILTVGPPGCGKTTWAENFVERLRSKGIEVRNVNRDDCRKELTGSYNNFTKEDSVTKLQTGDAVSVLKSNGVVIVSDTNINPKTVDKWHGIAKSFDVPVFEKHFKDSLDFDLLVHRNKTRSKKVPDHVLRDFYRRYREANFKPYVRDTSKSRAVIFDVDGTLAKMVSRGPYDWKKVDEDEVHQDVADIARMYFNYHESADINIIILTGRDGSAEEKTREWLIDNNIPFDSMFIRPEGNFEKDSILKYDIFKKHIEPNYNVIGVYDDRDQVVQMWREIGRRRYQVANGNF